ncbi:MAG: type II toxin-antitoxin system HicA family toxin [Fimbriimonadaceae bacterium]|nr:type II toxin-antitoxin system HicA family toxin [Fimbriimonadaceae bacterium]
MPRLPVVSGREARRAFERAGWVFDRQRGSHMILGKPNSSGMLSIPDHRELDTGLLRGLVRDSGLSVEEFIALL